MGNNKQYLKEERNRLEEMKKELEKKIGDIDAQLVQLDRLEKPFVACVQSYSGGGRMAFDTLEKAEKKLQEYKRKKYFRNGLNYGVYMFRYHEDGSRELLKEIPLTGHYRTPDFN